jgi:hypothetical protein
MSSPASAYSIAHHFSNKDPIVKEIYDTILNAAKELGAVREDAKKTSIHLVNNSPFAGIATRKSYLILTVKSKTDLKSSRIARREQASASRWHLEIKLESPGSVDTEVIKWLKASYEIS